MEKTRQKVFALPNPNLRWEQTDQFNAGFDMALFDYRLSFGFDGYYKHTRDAFNNTPVSSINGTDNYVMNGSDLYNSGFSINLTAYPIKTRDWSWMLSVQLLRGAQPHRNEVHQRLHAQRLSQR